MDNERLEERIKILESKLESHEGRIRHLENHVSHPPAVRKLMEEIENRKVVTVKQLREHFPNLYGGVLNRLYDAIRNDPHYIMIEAVSQYAPTIIAFLGNDFLKTPEDPMLMAIDYFQHVPVAKHERTVDAIGRSRKIMRGGIGSLQDIMKRYKISEDKAYEVWRHILNLFKNRIRPDHTRKTFQRRM